MPSAVLQTELVQYSINLTNYIGLLNAFLDAYALSGLGSLLSLKLIAEDNSMVWIKCLE
jgi:hypothetical protein